MAKSNAAADTALASRPSLTLNAPPQRELAKKSTPPGRTRKN